MHSIKVRRRMTLPACGLFLLLHFPAPCASSESELDRLVAVAMEHNPRVAASAQRLTQALAEHRGVSGFFDPRFSAAGGRRDGTAALPGASRDAGLPNYTVGAAAGIEAPVRPGAYVSVGVSEHHLLETGESENDASTTLAGARLWVPLARDRGLAEWSARDRQAFELANAAAMSLLAVRQTVRRDVELAYWNLVLRSADAEEARHSTARVKQLLKEAEGLVELRVVPEYQLSAARMEVALRLEEEAAALNLYETERIGLVERIGVTNALEMAADKDTLAAAAARGAADPSAVTVDPACARRGDYLGVESRLRAAEAAVRLSREKLKHDIALSLSATWRKADPEDGVLPDSDADEEEVGTEAALVWQGPLGRRTEKAEVAALRAAARALEEERRETRLRIDAELRTARGVFLAARTRLELATGAVGHASSALEAEEERFRLGEGRSRNVLDAQKDLTAAVLRRNAAAAELLRSRANLAYAAGYPDEPAADSRVAEPQAPENAATGE